MASFIYNTASDESRLSQWQTYLQQQEYKSDITSAIDDQTLALKGDILEAAHSTDAAIAEMAQTVVGSMEDAATAIAESIERGSDRVLSRLEEGFADVEGSLSEIKGDLSNIDNTLRDLGRMLDWRLSLIADQLRVSNLLLENVALLLRIPDVQKERQYHIEQGFKHYKNARLDPDLYQDALDNLLKAEEREKADYIILHRIGMIYLYVPKMLNVALGEEYFRRASKYAVVESDPRGTRLFNILAGDVNRKLRDQSAPTESVKMLAAESLFQAGVACYVQGKFADAAELSGKAFLLAPSFPEAGFTQAKALVAQGDNRQAAKVLENVIKTDRAYSVKTVADSTLAKVSEAQSLLLRLRDDAVAQAKERAAKCRAAMLPDSSAASILVTIETLVARNTYLDALAALDALSKERDWQLPLYLSLERVSIRNDAKCEGLAFGYLAYDPTGTLVAFARNDGAIKLSDKKTEKSRILQAQDRYLRSVAFNSDGTILASRPEGDSALVLWGFPLLSIEAFAVEERLFRNLAQQHAIEEKGVEALKTREEDARKEAEAMIEREKVAQEKERKRLEDEQAAESRRAVRRARAEQNAKTIAASVLGLVLGAAVGFVIAFVAAMISAVVVAFLPFIHISPTRVANIVFPIVWPACIIIGVIIGYRKGSS